MNATLQCFRAIPELKSALSHVRKPMAMDERQTLTYTMSHLINELDSTTNPVTPLVFLSVLDPFELLNV
jgi:hypothetical protein